MLPSRKQICASRLVEASLALAEAEKSWAEAHDQEQQFQEKKEAVVLETV